MGSLKEQNSGSGCWSDNPCHLSVDLRRFPGLLLVIPRGNIVLMDEIWKTVEGYDGYYEVSNLGRMRTWKRKECKWKNPHSNKRLVPHIIRGHIRKHGYTVFTLRKLDQTKKTFLLHRIVAYAFLGSPTNGQTDVAHLDGNPGNNILTNLKWTTHKENQDMMSIHGTMQYGEKSVTCVLTLEQVLYIREYCKMGIRGSQRRMSEKFKISPAQIHRIVHGKRWIHAI